MTTEVQWSELQRDLMGVAALVDAGGDVRVRRRDGVALILTREDRTETTRTGAMSAARTLRAALLRMKPEQTVEVLRDEFPWLDVLPPAERAEFGADFARGVWASAELGVWDSLAETVTQWKATAALHADTELATQEFEAVDADPGEAPDPNDKG